MAVVHKWVCGVNTFYMYIHVYIYKYIYIFIFIYLFIYTQNYCLAVAQIVRFSFQNLLVVQAKRVFSILKFKKMHFDPRPPMNLSTSILRGRRSVL